MPHPATVRREARERRARLQRILRESARDRAPLPTVKHVKARALALAYMTGAATVAALVAILALTR